MTKRYSILEVFAVAIIAYIIASVFFGDGLISGIIAGVCGAVIRDIDVDNKPNDKE